MLLNQRLGLFSLFSGQYPTQSSNVRTSGAGMTAFSESTVEEFALAWLRNLGCEVRSGPDITPVNQQPNADPVILREVI